MTIEAEIAALTTANNSLINTFNIKKTEIEQAVIDAIKAIPDGGKTLYVDQVNGSDENSGLSEVPLKSLKEAAARKAFGGYLTIRLLSDYTFTENEYFGNGFVHIISDDAENKKTINFGSSSDGTTIKTYGLVPQGYAFLHLSRVVVNLPDISALLGSPTSFTCICPRSSGDCSHLSLKMTFVDMTAPASTIPLLLANVCTLDIMSAANVFTNMPGNWIKGVSAATNISTLDYLNALGINTL